MARTSRPITVTLEALQARVEAYASASEVLRAAVRALDREEAAVIDWVRKRVEESLADPRPNTPGHGVFRRLREHHARRLKASHY